MKSRRKYPETRGVRVSHIGVIYENCGKRDAWLRICWRHTFLGEKPRISCRSNQVPVSVFTRSYLQIKRDQTSISCCRNFQVAPGNLKISTFTPDICQSICWIYFRITGQKLLNWQARRVVPLDCKERLNHWNHGERPTSSTSRLIKDRLEKRPPVYGWFGVSLLSGRDGCRDYCSSWRECIKIQG